MTSPESPGESSGGSSGELPPIIRLSKGTVIVVGIAALVMIFAVLAMLVGNRNDGRQGGLRPPTRSPSVTGVATAAGSFITPRPVTGGTAAVMPVPVGRFVYGTSGTGYGHTESFAVASGWKLAYAVNCPAPAGATTITTYDNAADDRVGNPLAITGTVSGTQAMALQGPLSLLIGTQCAWQVAVYQP